MAPLHIYPNSKGGINSDCDWSGLKLQMCNIKYKKDGIG